MAGNIWLWPLRRDTITAIATITKPRTGATSDNIETLKGLLMSDEYSSGNDDVLANKRLADMPSSLAAFCGRAARILLATSSNAL